jgi:hypothetical protein
MINLGSMLSIIITPILRGKQVKFGPRSTKKLKYRYILVVSILTHQVQDEIIV